MSRNLRFSDPVIDELAAPDIRFEYSMHAPRRGRDDVRKFATEFRAAFPDLNFRGTANLLSEGDYVVGQWEGGKKCASPEPPCFGVENSLITEEVGLDDGVTVLKQLGLIPNE
ncbi:MAG: ester cyclase [Pseudonocardiaceae bacterium]